MDYCLATFMTSLTLLCQSNYAQFHRHNERHLRAAKSQILILFPASMTHLHSLYVQDMGTPDLISAPVMAREAGIESIISTVSTYTSSAIV